MSEAEAEEKAKKRIAFLSREIKANDSLYYPVSYTHLTLPTKA